jgi:hypothetical protein
LAGFIGVQGNPGAPVQTATLIIARDTLDGGIVNQVTLEVAKSAQ